MGVDNQGNQLVDIVDSENLATTDVNIAKVVDTTNNVLKSETQVKYISLAATANTSATRFYGLFCAQSASGVVTISDSVNDVTPTVIDSLSLVSGTSYIIPLGILLNTCLRLTVVSGGATATLFYN